MRGHVMVVRGHVTVVRGHVTVVCVQTSNHMKIISFTDISVGNGLHIVANHNFRSANIMSRISFCPN